MSKENVIEKKQNKFRKWIELNRSNFLVLVVGVPIIFTFFYPLLSGKVTGPSYYIFSMTLVFIFAAMTLSLNLEVGFLGIPNFGKVAFIAVGAYSYAITIDRLQGNYHEGESFLFGLEYTRAYLIVFALFVAIVMTGIFGALLTLPTLRLREDYLAIVTIVAGEIVRVIAFNQQEFGGFAGFFVGNPTVDQFSATEFLAGVFLRRVQLFFVLGIYAILLGIYTFQTRNLDGNDVVLYNSYQRKLLRNSVFAAIIVILFDFFKSEISVSRKILTYKMKFKIFGEPSMGLHLALLSLILGLVLYSTYLKNVLKVYEFFSIMAVFALVNYIVGISVNERRKGLTIFGSNIDNVTNLRTNEWFGMLFAFLVLLLVYVIMEEIANSPFGRTLRAIREDDTSAISVGKSIFEFRLRALIITSAISGLVGAVYAQIITVVSPLQFLPLLTFTLYIMLIIGGTGNNKGAIFGAAIIQLLFQITRGTLFVDSVWYYPDLIESIKQFTYVEANRQINPFNIGLIFVGVMLIVFLIYAPEGIIPEVKKSNPKYYELVKHYDSKLEEEGKLYEFLKSLTKAEETEDWVTND
ncbi:MAG: branched-chain amino acid ABC transporter permease [Candidatus Kariarchaeaceae archaeon]|jgi:ABC-type branched-subunit amino acid transport system permease subunit